MIFLKRTISLITVLFMLSSYTYAEETKNVSYKATIEDGNVSVVETELTSDVDNSNLQVEVIKQIGEETTVIYTGNLGGYADGIWNTVDFSEIQFLVIFDWNTMEEEAIYIRPISNSEVENAKSDITNKPEIDESKEIAVYQNSVIQTGTDNAEINVSLLYNNSYSESVLLPGEELTAELEILNNNTEDDIEISAIVSLYDDTGKFVDMNVESITVAANSTGTFNNKTIVPVESTVTNAKIMIWESINSLKPYTAPVILTLSGTDFFGDDYLLSQPINGKNKANGKINGTADTDVFSFVPQNDGLYYFETLSDIDTFASLYADNNLTTPISTDDNSGADDNFRLSATLEAGTTYYLYMNGRGEGQYILNYGYSIGNIYGTVSPVKFFDDDTEFNSLIEGKVELNTYYTGEFVATMHLKDWSVSNNQYASYSMTGVHSGDYLVKTKRPGYLTCYQKISLVDNTIDLGSITLIPGDANGDDVIDSADLNLVNSLVGSEYGSESYVISADINSDKVINSEDVNLVNANLNKNSNEYASNVNVLFIDVETYDTQLIVTGNAAPNSTVSCVVFYEDYSIYEGETACSSDGLLEFIVDLNKSGNYTVLVTSDNHAYEVTETITY